MEKCTCCGIELGVERRWAKIDGKEFYFCPTNTAPLAPDCLNTYLMTMRGKRRRFNDANLQPGRSP